MFGIKLSPNFNRPFAARSTADFWRRWHMSLSFWVRDYLYVPLTAGTRNWGQWESTSASSSPFSHWVCGMGPD